MNGVTLIDCPKCRGVGERRERWHEPQRCGVCGGNGQVSTDWWQKERNREGSWVSCDACGEVRWCVLRPGVKLDEWICAECWTRQEHPELLAVVEYEEAPF